MSHPLICNRCIDMQFMFKDASTIQLSPNLLKRHKFPSSSNLNSRTLTKPIVLSGAHQMFSARLRAVESRQLKCKWTRFCPQERKGDHWARLRMENRAISRSLTRLHKSRQGLNAYFLPVNGPPGPKVVDQRCYCSTRAVREAIGLIWSTSDRWKCFYKGG